MSIDHYPVLAAQLGRCAEGPEREPKDDDGLTGPCPECNGKGIVYSDPDNKQLTCGDCEGCEEDDEEQDTRAREQNEAMREDTEDYRRELARFDAERWGR